MKKNEYLALLNSRLTGLSESEKVEIILDFEEHFSAGFAKGKTEDEICEQLGDPVRNAEQYTGASKSSVPLPPAPPQAPGSYRAQATYAGARQGGDSRTTYLVLFIFAVILASIVGICAVPTALGGAAIFVGAFAAGAFTASFLLSALLLSIGVFIMAASVLVVLLSIWLCLWLYRRYSANKEGNAQ